MQKLHLFNVAGMGKKQRLALAQLHMLEQKIALYVGRDPLMLTPQTAPKRKVAPTNNVCTKPIGIANAHGYFAQRQKSLEIKQ